MPSRAEARTDFYGDRVDISAASLRAPMRSETLAIAVTTAQKQYEVPDGLSGSPLWKGRIVNMFADGADVYIQVSDALDAAVDETAVALETLVPSTTRYRLTPPATPNGCWKIPNGQWLPIPFEKTNQTFAVKATGTAKLRTHVAET